MISLWLQIGYYLNKTDIAADKSNDNWDAITTGCHSVQIGHPSSTNEPLIQHEWTPHSVPMEGDE